jgi:hypothetical protein
VTDKRHTYSIRVDWTGKQGAGTSAYRTYSRAHEIALSNVRFWVNSGHRREALQCLLLT